MPFSCSCALQLRRGARYGGGCCCLLLLLLRRRLTSAAEATAANLFYCGGGGCLCCCGSPLLLHLLSYVSTVALTVGVSSSSVGRRRRCSATWWTRMSPHLRFAPSRRALRILCHERSPPGVSLLASARCLLRRAQLLNTACLLASALAEACADLLLAGVQGQARAAPAAAAHASHPVQDKDRRGAPDVDRTPQDGRTDGWTASNPSDGWTAGIRRTDGWAG